MSSDGPRPDPVEPLDPLIHERSRLAILSALAVNDALSFNDLKRMLDMSDGNLSVHAQKLESPGYIECRKSFLGRKPNTEYAITNDGRRMLDRYLTQMESIIRRVRDGNPA